MFDKNVNKVRFLRLSVRWLSLVKNKKAACTFLIVIFVFSMFSMNVRAQPQTKLFVDPSTYTATLLDEVFTINISVTNVQYFVAFDFKLGYNTTILDALTAVEGSFLVNPYLAVAINETEGYLRIWGSCGRTNGNGTVAMINFKATYGESAYCLLDLYDTKLFALPPFDFNITQIPHDVEDGNYEFAILDFTVETNKPYYLPGENIEIHGNLTQDGQPIQGLVALEIDDPINLPMVVRTIKVDPTPPPEEVSILEAYTSDEFGEPKTSFIRNASFPEPLCYVKVIVKNNNPTEAKNIVITANSYDINMVSLCVNGKQMGALGSNMTWSTIIGIPIPEWAALGNATVYVNAFNQWPGRGYYGEYPQYGIPYCPEKNATFEIIDGDQGAGGSGAQSASNISGTYNYIFGFPTSVRAGIYQVYAVSFLHALASRAERQLHAHTMFGANAIYVPDYYSTIQEAVDAATPTNNSIMVMPGTYNEDVTINKSLSLIGIDSSNTVINGSGTGNVVTVTADNVKISGFTIQNSGDNYSQSGIILTNSSHSTISENIILKNCNGIYITNSSQENIIRDNTITLSNGHGINIRSSNYNEITGNMLSNNNHGIYINRSTSTTLRDNSLIDNNLSFGVFGDSMSDFIHSADTSNTIDGKPMIYLVSQQNKLVSPNAGYIAIVDSSNMTVRGLNLTKNGQGLLLAFTTDSLVERVNTTNNEYGMYLVHSHNNTIVGSEIANNSVGVHQKYCTGNTLCHNNFVNNIQQLYNESSTNTWDDSDGKGNHWSDYNGADLDDPPDGIGDEYLPWQGVDYYPVIDYWISVHDVAVTNVTYVLPCDESQLYSGWLWKIEIIANLKNEGDFTENFNVTAYYNGNSVATKVINELTPQKETAKNLTWDTSGVSPGNYTISAEASAVAGENDTTDNIYIDGNVTLLIPTVHDLNVTSVIPIIPYNYSHVCSGWVINVTVIVKNEGHFAETANITAHYDGSIIDTRIVTLYPPTSTALNLTWDTSGVSPGNYTISAEASAVAGENDTTDNAYVDGMIYVILQGDVNDNGQVNVIDMLLLKIAITLGKTVEEFPFYDVDGNGQINVMDMLRLRIIMTIG